MERIIVTIIVFLFLYLLYFFTVIRNKKKLEDIYKSGQASFIIKRYQLDVSKINKKVFAQTIALINSFIIAITFLITDFIANFILKFLIGFILLVPLILFSYHMIGIYYKKKEVKKTCMIIKK